MAIFERMATPTMRTPSTRAVVFQFIRSFLLR
jgi:hypothetical protein